MWLYSSKAPSNQHFSFLGAWLVTPEQTREILLLMVLSRRLSWINTMIPWGFTVRPVWCRGSCGALLDWMVERMKAGPRCWMLSWGKVSYLPLGDCFGDFSFFWNALVKRHLQTQHHIPLQSIHQQWWLWKEIRVLLQLRNNTQD